MRAPPKVRTANAIVMATDFCAKHGPEPLVTARCTCACRCQTVSIVATDTGWKYSKSKTRTVQAHCRHWYDTDEYGRVTSHRLLPRIGKRLPSHGRNGTVTVTRVSRSAD